MTFKSTKYAKIITDAKKYGLFDNIRLLQLRFNCKYYKKNCAYRSECPEIIGKNLFGYLNLLFSVLGGFPAKNFELLPRLFNR